MPKPSRGGIISSLHYASRGVHHVLASERNARIHLVAALLVIALGVWLELSAQEWALIVCAIGLVFAGEMLNTVVEVLVDLVTLEENPLAKRAKDIAAGAVLVVSVAAAVVGVLILGPGLWQRLAGA